MNMFARFDENPAMNLQDIKETKRYGRTHGQRENSIPPTNKVCGGYKKYISTEEVIILQCSRSFLNIMSNVNLNADDDDDDEYWSK